MIIYYSATGNCKYVAKKIVDKTRDIAVSMIGHDYFIYLKKGESLGIVVPVHFWGLSCICHGVFVRNRYKI